MFFHIDKRRLIKLVINFPLILLLLNHRRCCSVSIVCLYSTPNKYFNARERESNGFLVRNRNDTSGLILIHSHSINMLAHLEGCAILRRHPEEYETKEEEKRNRRLFFFFAQSSRSSECAMPFKCLILIITRICLSTWIIRCV